MLNSTASSSEHRVPSSTKLSCNSAIPTRALLSPMQSKASSELSDLPKTTSLFTPTLSTTGMPRPVRLRVSGILPSSTVVRPTKTCRSSHSCSLTETSMPFSPLTIPRTPHTAGRTDLRCTRRTKKLSIKHRRTTSLCECLRCRLLKVSSTVVTIPARPSLVATTAHCRLSSTCPTIPGAPGQTRRPTCLNTRQTKPLPLSRTAGERSMQTAQIPRFLDASPAP